MRYNLRTDDEATMESALRAAALIDQWGRTAKGVTLDVIGTIYRETGEMREVDGALIPVTEAIPGWHANLIASLSPEQTALLPIIPAPAQPYRVFAGE